MIDEQTKYIADDFVRTLQSAPEIIDYLSAIKSYNNDEELIKLTEKYYELSSDFQRKQYDGTLTQQEIAELRMLAKEIQSNPLNQSLFEKQAIVKDFLQNINQILSNEISMDFAKFAAPSSCCS